MAAVVPCAVAFILLHIPICYGLYIFLKRRRDHKVCICLQAYYFGKPSIVINQY